MFQPLPLFVGLRYVRTRRQGFFVSFISWVSMLGVCLGVAALITIISVMNGFEGELRSRLVALTAHATVVGPPAQMADWPAVARRALTVPGARGAAPFRDVQAMLGRSGNLRPALLHGLDPAIEGQVSAVAEHLLEGHLADLTPGSRKLILGRALAWQLGVDVGEELTVMVPGRDLLASGGRPVLQTFTVAGIFELGLQEHDGSVALVNLADAADLAGGLSAPEGLRVRYDDVMSAPGHTRQLAAALGAGFTVKDWSQEHAAYFRAIRIEKTMMSLILMLVVAVAAFNIVAALVMVVNEKRSDIAILRTLGLPPSGVVGVFLTQGLLIGAIGTLLGVLLGLVVAANVDAIVPFLEGLFHFHFMDPSVYYITTIPSELRAGQVALIAGSAFVLTVLATIYPARRGAATEPAEALRYE
ncbi:MAG TPA: lipoprotein-releasing ABC transporter permease subunit [Steroidobacteraceae bacterium]|nr:lipoprotein-releasing ABC transporter permease subunit [Steroidobacteraceae bacterium]